MKRRIEPVVRILLGVSMLVTAALVGAPASPQSQQLSEADVQKLYSLLENGDHYKVRYKTARVLGMMRLEESLPHLIKAFREDPDHMVRAACAWSLGSINHPGAVADLKRAAGKEVPLVQKNAERALNHVLSSFPGNIPDGGKAPFRILIDDFVDRATKGKELTAWAQQYFLDLMVNHKNIDVGTDMDIEEDGETPDVAKDYRPLIVLALNGGVTAVTAPKNRAAGEVVVTIAVSLLLDPVQAKAMAEQKWTGKAQFAGGEKPADAWSDDPFVEAEKAALKEAVGKAFVEVSKAMKLKR
jgi:hypothetical protein